MSTRFPRTRSMFTERDFAEYIRALLPPRSYSFEELCDLVAEHFELYNYFDRRDNDIGISNAIAFSRNMRYIRHIWEKNIFVKE